MASGKTHDKVGLMGAVTLAMFLTAKTVLLPYEIAWTMAGYGVGIVWLSPDIDMKGTRPYQRFGILQPLAFLYASTFKHRGVSHCPIAGTVTRSVFVLPFFIWYPNPVFIACVLVGMEISTWVHLFCDYFPGVRKL